MIDDGQLAIDMPITARRSPLEEACPTCAAPPGEPCTTHNGDEARYEHAARRRRANYLPIGGNDDQS